MPLSGRPHTPASLFPSRHLPLAAVTAAGLVVRDVPFDLIRSHAGITEATTSAFDLETVSTFGVQTTAPGDYAWRIPCWAHSSTASAA